ncbi:colorectal cancer-associated protein 2 [Meleagris gallopavo]|uniref:colorectal cancer-associated protein 2 n=1 Tax=Meleagris gallopavo TaxID=9103 RepID=UPI000549C7D6|nr:colorectal cancer-associated protein 2 [Meleagris gallopavo]
MPCAPKKSPILKRVFPPFLSGKPKVYQGVRVKITVKELLQQRRARQAATGAAVSWGSNSIQFAESVSPPHPAPFDAEPISSAPNYCPSRQFSNCLSCEESPSHLEQLVDSYLQAEAAFEPSLGALQTPSHYIPDSFQPVPLCFNQGLAAASPSPADLPNALPHGCPAPQLPPFTPLTHSPPPALDPTPYGCPAEGWPCHPPSPYTPLACCCAACSPPHADPKVPQRFPCPGTDCSGCLPPTDDFFRRDRSWDICYS